MNGAVKLISVAWGDDFYKTSRWRSLRENALKLYGSSCCKCGNPNKDLPPEVDHIKPRSKYPELALSINNLQVLCKHCNSSKGNHHTTDYRSSEQQMLAEKYLTMTKDERKGFLRQRRIIEAIGQEEFNRRKKQKQLDKKKNPKKQLSKKDKRDVLKLQVTFLFEIRLAKENGTIHEVMNGYTSTYGEEIVAQMIKRCNVEHWIN